MWQLAALVLLFANVALPAVIKSECKYKSISTKDEPHTMCVTNPIGSNCTGKTAFPLKQKLKDSIVKAHNIIRQKVASGNVTGMPGARLMYEMTWNDEIAAIAQRWADQCNYKHDANRDIVRSGKQEWVGQNIYLGSANYVKSFDFNSVMDGWFYKELKFFDSSNIKPFVSVHACGHLTEIAWGETKQVGCGISNYTSPATNESDGEPWIHQFVVCNYFPGGNIIDGTLYDVARNKNQYGDKCAVDSVKYPPLCAP